MLVGQHGGSDGCAARMLAVLPRLSADCMAVADFRYGKTLLFFGHRLQLVLALRVPLQLHECAEKVNAHDQDQEGGRAVEASQTGLPGHPATASQTETMIKLTASLLLNI